MSRTSRWAIRRRCPWPTTSARSSASMRARRTRTGSPTRLSEPASQRTVAATLTQRTGMAWDPADVAMTNGGFAALAVTMRTLLEPGDEMIFLSPPWFFYELLILAAGGEPRRVRLEPPAFDLDVERIVAAIGPRTRAVLVNSPHNPSGRIYPPEVLRRPGRRLDRCLRAHRSPDLDRLRRALQPDRLRRPGVPQPGRVLPAHGDHLLVREDAAGAGPAHRLHHRAAHPARIAPSSARRSSSSSWRPATPSPTRCCSTR